MAEFLNSNAREQLATMAAYISELREGGNLVSDKFLMGQSNVKAKASSGGPGAWALNFKDRAQRRPKPYSSLSFEPSELTFLLATLSGKNEFSVLRKLKTHHFTFFVPKMRLFKVYTNPNTAEKVEVEIEFPNAQDGQGAARLSDQRFFFLSGAGIQNFEAIFQGVNEAEVENNIRCSLSMFFTSLNEMGKAHPITDITTRRKLEATLLAGLTKDRIRELVESPDAGADDAAVKTFQDFQSLKNDYESWRYLDLITPPERKRLRSDGRHIYINSDYQIRMDFGWSVDLDSLMASHKDNVRLFRQDAVEIKKIVERLNYGLYLNLMTHTFNLTEQGAVQVTAEFIGAAQQGMDDPAAVIFRATRTRGEGGRGIDLRHKQEALELARLSLNDARRENPNSDATKEEAKKFANQQAKFEAAESRFLQKAFGNFLIDVASQGGVAAQFLKSKRKGNEVVEREVSISVNESAGEVVVDDPRGDFASLWIDGWNSVFGGDKDQVQVFRANAPGFQHKTLLFSRRFLEGKGAEIQKPEDEQKNTVRAMLELANLPLDETEKSREASLSDDEKKSLNEFLEQATITPEELFDGAGNADNRLTTRAALEGRVALAGSRQTAAGAAAVMALATVDASLSETQASANTQEQQKANLQKARDALTGGVVKFIASTHLNNPLKASFVGRSPSGEARLENRNVNIEAIPVTFVTIGEILEVALAGITSTQAREFRIVLGTMNLTRESPLDEQGTSEVYYMPIADIPITYKNFYTWFIQSIVAREGYSYTINDFLKRGLRQLLSLATENLSFLGFRSLTASSVGHYHFTLPKKVADKAFGANWPHPVESKAPGNNFVSLQEFRAATDKASLTAQSISGQSPVNVVFINDNVPSELMVLTGDLRKDEKEGIKHFFVGAESDIMKSAKFTKDNLPGFRESRIRRSTLEGVSSQFALLSEPYLLTLKLIGNGCFLPGMHIFFHPTVLGLKGASEIESILQGYYMVYEVKQYLESGNYETELKCRYEGPGFTKRLNYKEFKFEPDLYYDKTFGSNIMGVITDLPGVQPTYTPKPPPACFLAGTAITMVNNTMKAIEKINVGDCVTSYSPDLGHVTEGIVSKTHCAAHKGYYSITFANDQNIQCTSEHPFFMPLYDGPRERIHGGKFLQAQYLKKGSVLTRLGEGQPQPVVVNEIRYIDKEVEVFNITVDGVHTYLAGGVIVHNKNI